MHKALFIIEFLLRVQSISLGGFLEMSRSDLLTLTHQSWLVCCGRLTHGLLPGSCLCMPDSNLGPVLPAGRVACRFFPLMFRPGRRSSGPTQRQRREPLHDVTSMMQARCPLFFFRFRTKETPGAQRTCQLFLARRRGSSPRREPPPPIPTISPIPPTSMERPNSVE